MNRQIMKNLTLPGLGGFIYRQKNPASPLRWAMPDLTPSKTIL